MEKLKYQVLADALRTAIRNGKYAHGEKLPSENELSEMYGYSRQTVRQAIGILDAEGLTERLRGSGTYVKSMQVRRSQMRNVAVISTYITEYIFPNILAGIQQELSAHGYTAMLLSTNNRVDNERRILDDLLQKPIDGLLIEATKSALPNPNIDLYRRFQEYGIPVVFFNGYYPALPSSVVVMADDRQGGHDLTDYLIRKGHMKIAGIFKSDDMQGPERYMGYVSALIEHGLSVMDDNILWFPTKMRKEIIHQFALDTVRGCTAVVCYNDEVAVPLLNLLLEAGLSVPGDMAVVSFDKSTMSDLAAVPITSLEHPKKNLGIEAASRLIRMIEGVPQKSVVLPWRFAERESS